MFTIPKYIIKEVERICYFSWNGKKILSNPNRHKNLQKQNSSDNPCFYCIQPRNISETFTIIRDLCRFLQAVIISSTTFYEKVGFPIANHKKIYKRIMDLILNDWKYLLRTETSQKFLLKTFYYSSKGTRKVKDFQKLSNKEIYFILQYNSTKYNKPFKSISWPNFPEGRHILSPEIWGKTFTDWFKKLSDGYI